MQPLLHALRRPRRDRLGAAHAAVATGGRIGAVGALIAACEELSRPSDMAEGSLQSWSVRRTAHPVFRGRWRGVFDLVMRHPNHQVVTGLRALAALGVMFSPTRSRRHTVCAAGLSGLLLVKGLRSSYGSDGSDQMTFLVTTASAIAGACPSNRAVGALMASAVAAQSTLAYVTSGVAKLRAPAWHNGDALEDVLRTHAYGDAGLYRWLIRDRRRSRWLSRAVVAAESLFPLPLVAGPVVRRAALGAGALFHLVNARYLGLNRFIWAFTATYPSVDLMAARLMREGSAPRLEAGGDPWQQGMSRAVAAAVCLWMAVTVLYQLHIGRQRVVQTDPTGLLVPNWSFFAPKPPSFELNLLYRSRSAGEAGSWKRIPTGEGRRWSHLLWAPWRRQEKALFDACTELLRIHHHVGDEAVRLSASYLSLLSLVSAAAECGPEPTQGQEQLQFMLVQDAPHEPSVTPSPVFLSGWH